MRLVGCVVALLIMAVTPSLADPPNPVSPVGAVLQTISGTPDGWSRNLDGSYKHPQSGVLCPTSFKSFDLEGLSPPPADNSNILGVCRYRDGEGRMGAIRVRKYVEGWGSEMSIAANDKALMAADAPAMLMRASVDRKTGASRLTVTTAREGYLIDCSVAQIEPSRPRGDFPLYCTTIP